MLGKEGRYREHFFTPYYVVEKEIKNFQRVCEKMSLRFLERGTYILVSAIR